MGTSAACTAVAPVTAPNATAVAHTINLFMRFPFSILGFQATRSLNHDKATSLTRHMKGGCLRKLEPVAPGRLRRTCLAERVVGSFHHYADYAMSDELAHSRTNLNVSGALTLTCLV